MRKHIFAAFVFGGLIGLVRAEDKPALQTDKEKVSYSLGLNIGNNWKRNDIEVDLGTLVKGLKDALAGGETLLSEEEAREVLMKYQQELSGKREEKRKQQAEKSKKEGAAFLEENKKKPGVVTLPSGLQYKIITEGQGESPQADDTVTVHYQGTLIDGTEFDSSHQRGEPATFRVGGVIKGWQEALQLMKPGAKWELCIPAELAYGEFGSPPKIGPGATLKFAVELLSVKKAEPPQPVTSDIIKVPSAEELKKGAKIETIKAEDLKKEIEKPKQPQ